MTVIGWRDFLYIDLHVIIYLSFKKYPFINLKKVTYSEVFLKDKKIGHEQKMHTFLLFPILGVKKNHFLCNDPYFPPLAGISGWWVLAWPPGSRQSSYALIDPATQ